MHSETRKACVDRYHLATNDESPCFAAFNDFCWDPYCAANSDFVRAAGMHSLDKFDSYTIEDYIQ